MFIELDNICVDFNLHSSKAPNIKDGIMDFLLKRSVSNLKSEQFSALTDISLTVKDGDLLAIIGKNGAGKTTLISTMSSIIHPTTGTVKSSGKISSLVGIGTGCNVELTGRENIYVQGLVTGYDYAFIQEKEKEIIDFADLGDFIDSPVKYYSTGMGMKLSFSIAINISPEILIVDELFAGGDIDFKEKAEAKIEKVISSARIFICCPHNMDYARSLCNKILFLENGKVQYYGNDIEKGIKMYESTVAK